jgi:CHAD domain-containing protein
LLRDELGPEAYVLENGTLRDAAARLAGARDAEVLLKTLDSIRAKFPAGAQPDGVRALRAQLLDQRARASERLLSDAQAVQGALYDLYSVQVRVPGWVGQQADFDVLAPGLRRIYRQGRDRYRLARADPSIEHLHDWRKRVKDLRHAAELLAPANRAGIGSLARRADKLGELLGEDHDLAVLGEVVACRRELFATPRDSERLQRLIEVRRERVQERALKAGAKLYRRGPSKFLGRLERDWRRAG